MASRPVTTATERYKTLLANAFERVCILEEQLDQALDHIRELEEGEVDKMAEPKLQVDRRLDRIEKAIEKLASRLTQGPDYVFSEVDAGDISKILRGEESEETDHE